MNELFDVDNNKCEWEKEWVGMPEYIQKKQKEFAKIIIRFENDKDLQEFSNLINQKLNKKTKSIWYPYKSHFGLEKKIWVDEE